MLPRAGTVSARMSPASLLSPSTVPFSMHCPNVAPVTRHAKAAGFFFFLPVASLTRIVVGMLSRRPQKLKSVSGRPLLMNFHSCVKTGHSRPRSCPWP